MEETRNERFMKFFEWTGLTSNGLSVKLGMNSRTIYNYTNRGMNPTDTCVRQICKVFPQINPDWLFDGIGEMLVEVGSSNVEIRQVASPDPVRSNDKVSKITELYERLVSNLESRCECLENQLKLANEMIEMLKNK